MRFIYRATSMALAVVALCGCETFNRALNPPASSLPWTIPNKATLCTENCTNQHETAALLAAASHCLAIYQYHGQYAGAAGAAHWTLGSLGTLAGAVIAPVAHGTAAKAWAGLSGATNALQLSLNNAFSATVELNRQKAVAQAIKDGLDAYQKADSTKKIPAAVAMSLGCATAGALADADTLGKLNTVMTPTGGPAAGTPAAAAGAPAAGTPAAGTPAAGTPAAGTPAAGTPAAGTPAAGAPAAGTPAAGVPAPKK